MIRATRTTPTITHKQALDSLVQKFNQQGWSANGDYEKDNQLLKDLTAAGYMRFGGEVANMEYGSKIVAALREIQKDWKKYEKVIVGTEALDASKFKVPDIKQFSNWGSNIQDVANFLADIGGGSEGKSDGILSQTNHVARLGFLGIFGREDMNKKPLTEIGMAKALQDTYMGKTPTDLWKDLGITAPINATQMEATRRAIFLKISLYGNNPEAIRDPKMADRVATQGIKERAQKEAAEYTKRVDLVKKALGPKNPTLPPEVLAQAAESVTIAVDTAGLLIGTGISLEEFAKNVKVDGDNPKVFSILSVGRNWSKQFTKNIQAHAGAGGSLGADTNGGFFVGAGIDAGMKFIVSNNGKMQVTKGNHTLELNAGVGTSILGFIPVASTEIAYRWNDTISALQSSDATTRNFLTSLIKPGQGGNLELRATNFDALTKEQKEFIGNNE